jgi:NADH:ubiquinone oxidoreductase subunit F (NADH-binding)
MPHRIIEGAIISAYAVNANEIIFYINAKAKLSLTRLKNAINQSYELNILGKNILGSQYSVETTIVQGAGGYVCGEETTLLNTLEGDRREPRIKPPFPTESGYKSSPTLINNCETLSNIPFILNNGPNTFKQIGCENGYGTKIISLSGSVNRPGVFEVEMGTS